MNYYQSNLFIYFDSNNILLVNCSIKILCLTTNKSYIASYLISFSEAKTV